MGIRELKSKWERENIPSLTQESLKWFYNFTRKYVTSADFNKVKGQGRRVSRVYPGKFYVYEYDPKHKETLPFYDRLPLVLVLSVHSDGWTGLNFHYMPPKIRYKIMEALLESYSIKGITEKKRLLINWAKAQRFGAAVSATPYLNHSIKRYLVSHVKSPIIEIEPENWEMILFLPLSKFQKARASKVWGLVK